jgi:hypothetical protein
MSGDVPARAHLILHGLGGSHLHGWLPGNDSKTAMSLARSRMSGGSDGAGHWWGVTRDGVGSWPQDAAVPRKRAEAVRFVTWAEVLDVAARGCGGGRREAYEAALEVFWAWARQEAWVPGESGAQKKQRQAGMDLISYSTAHDGIHEATEAIIVAGCAGVRVPVQQELFA